MRYTLLLTTLLLTSCQQALLQTNGEFMTVTPSPSSLMTPYATSTFIDFQPTLDYSGTQVVKAQQTANAALVVAIQATNDHEAREHEKLLIQQQNVMLTAQSDQWTATAYLTSVPLTATAQHDNSTAIANYNQVKRIEATQTAEAPELLIRTQTAKDLQKYSFIEYLIRYTVFTSFAIMLMGLAVYFFRKPNIVEREIIREIETQFMIQPLPEIKQEAVIAIEERKETPFPAKSNLVFPCTSEQLDELARKVILEGKSLAYDNFMGNESLFTRETYAPVYSFLQAQRLAISTGVKNKGIILTDKAFGPINGRDILEGWLNSRELPEGWTVTETPEATPPLSPQEPETGTSASMGQLVSVQRVSVGGESGS